MTMINGFLDVLRSEARIGSRDGGRFEFEI